MSVNLQRVSKSYSGSPAIQDVSLSFTPHAITAVIGPNGAGKSTLFGVMSGSDKPDEGTVSLGSTDVTRRAPDAIARMGLARTFQLTRTWPDMTPVENLLVASQTNLTQRFVQSLLWPRRHQEEQLRAAQEILHRVGLERVAEQPASTLSGGQRKLLELARALMLQPSVLLLDEPLAGVAPALGHRLLELVRELVDQGGLTVIFIEHDLEAVFRFSDEVVVLARGRVVSQGDPAVVQSDPAVASAYLGSTEDLR